MNTSSSFLVLEQTWEQAIPWIAGRLREAGLQVLPTFDLQMARSAHSAPTPGVRRDSAEGGVEECACPHHGTAACDCQFAVLLVYEAQGEPVSLVIHGHDGKTYLAFVDSPEQQANPRLSGTIQDGLFATDLQDAKPEGRSYAG